MPPRSSKVLTSEFLVRAYEAIEKMVPSTAEVSEGFALFTTPQDLKVLLAKDLDISESQATQVLKVLKQIGVYYPKQGGKGKPWRRYLKLNAQETVSNAKAAELKKTSATSTRKSSGSSSRKKRTSKKASGRKRASVKKTAARKPVRTRRLTAEVVVPPTPEPPAEEMWATATRGQLNLIFLGMKAKLDEQEQALAHARDDLTQEKIAHEVTKQELTLLKGKPSEAVFVLPAELAKVLG